MLWPTQEGNTTQHSLKRCCSKHHIKVSTVLNILTKYSHSNYFVHDYNSSYTIYSCYEYFARYSNLNRTQDDDMTEVKTITKKDLHHLAGHWLVSMQEAVHMVDEQELVICSDSMTHVSITQGQVLRNEQETNQKQDFITVYQNRPKNIKIYLWNISFTASLSTPPSETVLCPIYGV